MDGLTSAEAQKRLLEFGPNELQKPRELTGLKILISQFKSPLIYILVLAGLVTLFLQDFTDATVIFAAVFLNTALGFYQEFKAQKLLAALGSLLVPKAKVIRDGEQKIIPVREIVLGDLVVLTIGDQVPADGKLVEATDLTINEAVLTGESMPVKKSVNGQGLVFAGTTVTTGIGKMLVGKTGMETEMGKIGKAVGEVEEEKTPLQIQLGKLAKILAMAVGTITVLIFIVGELRGYALLEMFTVSVAIAVAAIPEGLTISLTVILALGMQRILKQKAVVRRLLAAETLGSVSVICVDKTGTLTEGKLRVVASDFTDSQLGIKAAVLCNDMRDPLETAMMEWALSERSESKDKLDKIKKEYPRLDEVPFSHKTKIIATLYPGLLLVSGAPEVVLQKCDPPAGGRDTWQKKFEEYGNKGYRLVGFAYQRMASDKLRVTSPDLENLNWLGILVYEDPVRVSVKEALQECQKAGIKVKVITGDYLPTALAVLEKLGLDGREHALTGEELEKMSTEELKKRVGDIVLFARTTPEQKLKIVQALKDKGEVVAMTGDGVNDAPALARADIGIVVGDASDVARETADMVLLDSNFSTIISAIEEGRAIFENIRKVVLYLISNSFMEVVLIGGAILWGLPLPVTAAQILWINLVTDSFPAIALAFEPKEKQLMEQPPRPKSSPILDKKLKTAIFIIALFSDLILLALFSLLGGGTVMFVALGFNSLFYVFACRSFRRPIFEYNPFGNKALTLAVVLGVLALAAAVYLPPLQILLKTQSLGLAEWFFLFVLGLANVLAIEIAKFVFVVRPKIIC